MKKILMLGVAVGLVVGISSLALAKKAAKSPTAPTLTQLTDSAPAAQPTPVQAVKTPEPSSGLEALDEMGDDDMDKDAGDDMDSDLDEPKAKPAADKPAGLDTKSKPAPKDKN